MLDDRQLLARYAADGSEAAFRELVGRYVNLVYSTALRRVGGDVHRAEDVTQLVFTDFARKASSLPESVVVAGWLHRATRYAAAQLIRTERRGRQREQEAFAMNALKPEPSPDWEQIRPLLDDALDRLGQADRDALLLRFFEQRSLAEVGNALSTNEDAARKRISRALDKLRAHLVRRGVTTTGGVLSVAISINAVQAAPAGLAGTLTLASLAGAASGTGTSLTLLKLMSMTKVKIGLGALVLAGAATVLVIEHLSQVALREENESLRRQVTQLQTDRDDLSNRIARKSARAPRLPAPPVRASTAPPAPIIDELRATNLYARFKDGTPKLTTNQAETYLKENGRSAAALLAAFRTSGDPALLTEAMQKYPSDPQVNFEAVFKQDLPPEERRRWLDSFKRVASENALADYLSAADHFKAGLADQAVQDLVSASGKQQFADYTLDRVQNDEEAYLSGGYSVAEAKTASSMQLLLPQLLQMKELGLHTLELADSYQQAGDESSRQAALQMVATLGQRYSNVTPGEAEVSQLVGMYLERAALAKMDPDNPYGTGGQTVQDRLDQLSQQRESLRELNRQLEPLLSSLSDQDWIIYKDRWRLFGEEAALRWVINKHGPK
jgi:RNA polymerase sigma factor (sigma-70 family)